MTLRNKVLELARQAKDLGSAWEPFVESLERFYWEVSIQAAEQMKKEAATVGFYAASRISPSAVDVRESIQGIDTAKLLGAKNESP